MGPCLCIIDCRMYVCSLNKIRQLGGTFTPAAVHALLATVQSTLAMMTSLSLANESAKVPQKGASRLQ